MSAPRSRRRPLLRIIAVLTALVGLTGLLAACGSADSADDSASGDATLRIGFISTTASPSGPEGWADETGILVPGLKDAGIGEVTWIPFKNGPDLSAAITGGSLDIAVLGDTPGLTAKANGLPTRLVNQSNAGLDATLFGAEGVTELSDLKGKTVATQVGSYMYRYLIALLEENDLDEDVKVSHVYAQDAAASLKSGGIAAYAAPNGQLSDVLSKQGYPVIDVASDHPDLLGSSVTVITEDALKKYPKLPGLWNEVRSQSIADLSSKTDEYYAFAAEATETSPEIVKAAQPIEIYKPEAYTDAGLKLLQGTNEFLADHEEYKTDSPVDIEAWKVD